MDTQKYTDMAYLNPTGIRWIGALAKDGVWEKFVHRMGLFIPEKVAYDPHVYARKILIAAIWHIGFANDLGCEREMKRCAKSLHTVNKNEGAAWRIWYDAYRFPYEFIELDNFLEYVVRDQVE
jgi:hypothetical protein